MTYQRSFYRESFDSRVNFLIKKARRSQRLKASDADIRDLVFQCAIFLTGAAIETYIRLIIEAWIQKVRVNNRGSQAPPSARAFIAAMKLENVFSRYHFNGDEKSLYKSLQEERDLWPFLAGDENLPAFFVAKAIYSKTTYPSHKNIKKLFSRIGIENIIEKLNKKLSRDVEVLIESFQSVRTALAHSAPPLITINDVESLLSESKLLIGALDRILYAHVIKHGGVDCWTI